MVLFRSNHPYEVCEVISLPVSIKIFASHIFAERTMLQVQHSLTVNLHKNFPVTFIRDDKKWETIRKKGVTMKCVSI